MNSYLQKHVASRYVGPLERTFSSPPIGIKDSDAKTEASSIDFNASRELPGGAKKRFEKRQPFWLISQNVDLLFVCGVAPWIAGCLMILLTGAGGMTATPKGPQQALMITFVIASLLIGESHQFTSIIRYYTAFRERKKSYKLARVPFWFIHSLIAEVLILTAIPATAVAFGFSIPFWSLVFDFSEVMFPVVLLHHVCAQACSIIHIYCANSNYKFDKFERQILAAFSYVLIATGACSIAAPLFSFDPSNMFGPSEIKIGTFLPPLYGCSVAFALVIAFSIISRGFKHNDWPPLGATVLLTNLVLFILLPVPLDAMRFSWLFVPLLFHATQHWAVAWHTHQKEQPFKADVEKKQKLAAFAEFCAPSLLCTVFILFLPMILTNAKINLGNLQATFSGQTLSVHLSMFVFYIHYFADRVVWRSRN